jgi:ribonuclease Z
VTQKNKSKHPFFVQILGANSALPANNRFPSAQVLVIHNSMFLIDCGEGTQMQLSKYGIRRNKINEIFISHLHGDHVFGLAGLITSYNHFGRAKDLSVFGPPGIEEMIATQLRCSGSHLNFKLQFIEIDTLKHHLVFENQTVEVHSIPLTHRVPTAGFLFKEKLIERNIDKAKIEKHFLSIEQIKKVKSGDGLVLPDQGYVDAEYFLKPPAETRSYAYCSDTAYKPDIVPIIRNVDMVYHETTFTEEYKSRAKETLHSTAKEAAMIAKAANAGKLITGHYSSRYSELDPILEEAQTIFENTELGIEGNIYNV